MLGVVFVACLFASFISQAQRIESVLATYAKLYPTVLSGAPLQLQRYVSLVQISKPIKE